MKRVPPLYLALAMACALPMSLPAQSTLGSRHTYSANYTTKLDAQNKILGYSFQTPDAPVEIAKAAILIGAASEPGQPVKVGFQEAVPNGNELVPSGSWIGEVTQETTLDAPGVKVIEFEKPVALPPQTSVFLMVESTGDGPAVSVTHYAAQRAAHEDGRHPQNSQEIGILDASDIPNASLGIFVESPEGTVKQWRAQAPIFALQATDGTPLGLPKMAVGEALASDATVLAQEFQVPADAAPLEASDLQLLVRASFQEGAQAMLKVQIEEVSDHRILGEQTLPLMETDKSGQISGTLFHLSLKPSVRLEPGKTYRLLLQASGLEKPNRIQFSTAALAKDFSNALPGLEKLTASTISRGLSISTDGGQTFNPVKESASHIFYLFASE